MTLAINYPRPRGLTFARGLSTRQGKIHLYAEGSSHTVTLCRKPISSLTVNLNREVCKDCTRLLKPRH